MDQIRRVHGLACCVLFVVVACGQKSSEANQITATPVAGSISSERGARHAIPDPQTLVTAEEASNTLGGDASFKKDTAIPIYPNSVSFSYQTKDEHSLSVNVYPQGGKAMFDKMKIDLGDQLSKTGCSGIGDSCFFSGNGMLHALKNDSYFTIDTGPNQERKLEELGRKVATRLP